MLAPQGYVQGYMAAGKRAAPNPGWNMLLPWRLTGPLDAAALLSGVDTVVERHEVLRTSFTDGAQVVHPHRPLGIRTVDLRGLPAGARGTELDRLARERHRLALDHTRGPLIAGLLVRATDDDSYLLLTIDHAVCDGWSIGVLLAELTAYYNGVVSGRGARLWPVPLQYREYAAEQRRTAAAGGYDGQLDWWAGQLAPGPLGLSFAPSAVDGYRSGQHPLVIPAGVAKGLRAARRGTLFMTLLTALTAVLARHNPTGDVAVTSLVAGRSRPELQRLIGMYANPVVLRTATAGAGTFGVLAERVRRGVLAAYNRQDVPFPLVAERTGIRAAEVWLNVAPPPAAARFRDLVVDTQALPRDYPIDVPAAAWRGEKLICNLADTGAEIVGLLDYNRNQLDPGTVARLADDLLAVLAAGPDGVLPATGDLPPL